MKQLMGLPGYIRRFSRLQYLSDIPLYPPGGVMASLVANFTEGLEKHNAAFHCRCLANIWDSQWCLESTRYCLRHVHFWRTTLLPLPHVDLPSHRMLQASKNGLRNNKNISSEERNKYLQAEHRFDCHKFIDFQRGLNESQPIHQEKLDYNCTGERSREFLPGRCCMWHETQYC